LIQFDLNKELEKCLREKYQFENVENWDFPFELKNTIGAM